MRLAIDVNGYAVHAAIIKQGRPVLVPLTDEGPSLPAVVRQTMHGLEVGESAAQSLVGNTETSVLGSTLLMGRAERVLARQAHSPLPFSLRAEGDEVVCNLLYAEVPITTCYGRLVAEVVRRAEARLGATIEDVVLTVPATAEDRFRVQARRAVEQEGIKVHRLINQPTAALLAAALPHSVKKVLVVHAGMATTDAVMAHRNYDGITIKAVTGGDAVNGDGFIHRITDRLMQQLQQRAGLNLQVVDGSGLAQAGLAQAVRAALPTLAQQPSVQIVLDHGGGFGRDVVLEVSRTEVESWTKQYLSDVGADCLRTLTNSKKADTVLLIGEMAFWPALHSHLVKTLNLTAGMLRVVHDQQLPVLGAALVGMSDAPTVWDVTPYPLGINCIYDSEELFSPILPANTPIPTPKQGQKQAFVESYQTLYPNQTEVRLDILQYRGPRAPETYGANRVYPAECEKLGSWLFDNLSPAKGQPAHFTVTFHVDRDGILHLCAAETETSRVLNAKVEQAVGA